MRIFIAGSTGGLGRMVAEQLVGLGHQVVLHARNAERAEAVLRALPGAACVVIADVASISANLALAEQLNQSGRFDAVIHNAGLRKAMTRQPAYRAAISII